MGSAQQNDQSWHNPQSKWRKNVRRNRVALIALGCAAFLLPLSIHAIDLYFKFTTPIPPALRSPRDIYDVVLFGAAWLFAIVVFTVLVCMAYRQHCLVGRIIWRDGSIRPWCKIDMLRVQGDDAAPSLRCERCNSTLPEAEVVQYWVNHWLNGSAAVEWFEEHHPRRESNIRRFLRSCAGPVQVGKMQRGWVIYMTGFGFAYVILLYFVFPTIYHVIAITLPIIAMFLVDREVYRRYEARVQAGRFCASCHYQLAPEQDAVSICPECASDWSKSGAVYSGKEHYSWGERAMLTLSSLVCIAILLWLYIGPFSPVTGSRWMSTPDLIERVSTHDGFLYSEWEELFDRELSEQERLALASGLLERRQERETLERAANAWFIDQIANDTLSQQIIDEYKADLLLLSVDVPEQVRIGEKIPIRITNVVQYQRPHPIVQDVAIAFGGFISETLDEPIGRTPEILSGSRFGSEWYIHGSRTRDDPNRHERDRGPIATITASKPGTLELRARYWIMLVPQQLINTALTWNDDGTAILPDGIVWVIEQDLTATLDVIPVEAQQGE